VEETVRRFVLGALLVTAVAVPVQAQVRVEIGIQLPGPPALVVIPGTPVYYAPRAPANVFFYAHQYWVFASGGWYVGPTWNGPWAVVEPVYVPAPILRVRRSGRHTMDVSGTNKPTNGTGVSVRNAGGGARGKAARRDSPSKDVADAGPPIQSGSTGM
jgi:hypothetical protein